MDDLLTAMAGLPLQTGRDSRTLPETPQAEVAQQDAFLAAFAGEEARATLAVTDGASPDPRAWAASPPPAAPKGQTVPMALAAEMLTQPSGGETVVAMTGQVPEHPAVNPHPALLPVRDPTGAWLPDRLLPDAPSVPAAGVVLEVPKPGPDAPLPDAALQKAGRAALMPHSEVFLPTPDSQPSGPVTTAAKPLAATGIGGATLAAPNPARQTIAVTSANSASPQIGEPDPQAAAAPVAHPPRPGAMPSDPTPIGREVALALAGRGNALAPSPGIIEPTEPVPTDRIGDGAGVPAVMTADGDAPGKAILGQYVETKSAKTGGMRPAPVPSAHLAVAPQAAADPKAIRARPENVPPAASTAAQGTVTAAIAGTSAETRANLSEDVDRPRPWTGSALSAAKTPGVIPVPSPIGGQGVSVPVEDVVFNPRAAMALPMPVAPVPGRALPLPPGAVAILAAPGEAMRHGAQPAHPELPLAIRAPEIAPKAVPVMHRATSQGAWMPPTPIAATLPDIPVAQGGPTSPPSKVDAAPNGTPVSGPTPIAAVFPQVMATLAVAQPRPEIGLGGPRAPQAFPLIAGPESEPPFGLASVTPQPMVAPGDRATPPDLPPQAARQIAVALAEVSRDPAGAVEVALDPPELGRVRLSLVEVNGAMTLSINAERPETADLMRRHLALLADEFARHGLDAPSVDISGGGQGGRGARDAQSRERHIEPLAELTAPTRASPPPPPHAQGGDGGLDLRL